jgi:hypothetical protein
MELRGNSNIRIDDELQGDYLEQYRLLDWAFDPQHIEIVRVTINE